jgi:hypothetical protein
MADQRLQQAEVLAKLGIAIRIVAQQSAIKEVKRQLRAQGLKLQQFTHREIVVAAEEYLAEHPELITETKPTVLRWFAEGAWKARCAGCAELTTDAQRAKACDASTLAVHISRAKWSKGNDHRLCAGFHRWTDA